MILKGSQRGGSRALARHLLNTIDNDHVELHEIQGLAATTLAGALLEIDAQRGASRGTKPFYHLSLNPPREGSPTVADYDSAIIQAADALGLTDQPRAVVFHEKEGRRHAHVVWSRIDQETGRFLRVSFDRPKLTALSASLFQQHGWRMPLGLEQHGRGQGSNFTHDEWMQAKRTQVRPVEHKRLIATAYHSSESLDGFQRSLSKQGYFLARGRRGFVAVDLDGEVHSVMRAVGQKKVQVESRLGDPARLPTAEQVQDEVQARKTDAIRQRASSIKDSHQRAMQPYVDELATVRSKHRAERQLVSGWQDQQRQALESELASRHRSGALGLVDHLTGRRKRVADQNAQDRAAARERDQQQRQDIIDKQITQRRVLKARADAVTRAYREQLTILREDTAQLLAGDRVQTLDRSAGQDQNVKQRAAGHRRRQSRSHGGPEP